VDSNLSSKYTYEIAKWGQEQCNIVVSHLIIQQLPSNHKGLFEKIGSVLSKREGISRFVSHYGFSMIQAIEYRGLKKIRKHSDHFQAFDLSEQVKQSIRITPLISKSGYNYRYSEEDISKVRNLGLDVLIRCGSGILRGDILNAARFGIISFHHADNTINRGGPAGFWEVYLRQASTGFTIQQLTEELDGGNVLFRGQFGTNRYFLLNQAELFEKSNAYLKKLLTYISKEDQLPSLYESYPYYNPLYKSPDLPHQFKYMYNRASGSLINKFNNLVLKKTIRWSVAFSYCNWSNLVLWKSIKIKNPPNHFLADPFVISFEGEDFCFVEDFDFKSNKGFISVYKLTRNGAERMGIALEEPFHLSYPFIFEYEGTMYLCPESAEKREIRLYECEGFPLKWKFKKTIMSNVSAVDTTIFEKDGRWWLFTNIDTTNTGDHGSDLYIYSADNPLSEDWIPHANNPIFVDSLKARMGGLLTDKKNIYRVSQQQGFDSYGRAVQINKIDCLTDEAYAEHTIAKIEPNFFPKLGGTHHLHSNGKITVFDYVKYESAKD